MVRLRLFASLRETAGTAEAEVPGSTVGEVISKAVASYGHQFERHLEHARIWLNGDPASLDDSVSEGDELALLPPVSGGSLAVPAGLDQQGVYVGLVFLVLAVTAIVPDRAWFAAAVVGVAAVWIVDLASAAGARQLGLNELPLRGAIFVAGIAAAAYGANGLGLAAAASVVLVVAWAVLVLRERDLARRVRDRQLCACNLRPDHHSRPRRGGQRADRYVPRHHGSCRACVLGAGSING